MELLLCIQTVNCQSSSSGIQSGALWTDIPKGITSLSAAEACGKMDGECGCHRASWVLSQCLVVRVSGSNLCASVCIWHHLSMAFVLHALPPLSAGIAPELLKKMLVDFTYMSQMAVVIP